METDDTMAYNAEMEGGAYNAEMEGNGWGQQRSEPATVGTGLAGVRSF